MAFLLTTAAAAQEMTVSPGESFCFSAGDFTTQPEDEGIFVTAVPSPWVATVTYGGRVLRPGDALPMDALGQLTLHSNALTKQTASVEYYTVSDGKVSGLRSMTLSILPKKNEAPKAENSDFETYRNIPNSGQLKASDPENGMLFFNLQDAPKRGYVELEPDGSFTYTPMENKVGKDRFTFTVTDEAGNVSEPAEVSVRIKKPSDKDVYADMEGDSHAFAAMWLKDENIFTGETVGGQLCFSPDQPVSRGEFLVMVMKLAEADTEGTTMVTGFSDEAETAPWLRPYLTTALRNGMITGVQSDDGLMFMADADMTQAEAAVMLQNLLQLPAADSSAVFAEETAVPVWAEQAVSALSHAGFQLQITGEADPLTRRDAAGLLYRMGQLMEEEAVSTFYWVQ